MSLTLPPNLSTQEKIKQYLHQQWDEPSEEFIKVVINDVYQGMKTKKVIDNFRDLVKQSLQQYVNEKVNDKLQKALNSSSENLDASATDPENEADKEKVSADSNVEIETTEEEIEGYVLIKLILKKVVDPSRVFYRDNRSYFNVLLDDNIRKWICRLGFNGANKYIQLNDGKRTNIKIDSVNDILDYKEEILAVAGQFESVKSKRC
jgi:predicted type IV restriction endonuclease